MMSQRVSMEADGVGGEARRFGTTSDSAFLFCFYESDSTFRTFLSPLRSPQSPGAKKRDRWQQLVRRKRLFKKKKMIQCLIQGLFRAGALQWLLDFPSTQEGKWGNL